MMQINNQTIFNHCPFCHQGTEKNQVIQLNNKGKKQFSSVDIELMFDEAIQVCSHCGSLFKNNIISTDQLNDLYSRGDSLSAWDHANFEKEKEIQTVELIKELGGKDKIVLDVGCNSGELLDFCKSLGAKTYGLELSKSAIEFCKSKGHTMIQDFEESHDKFDLICAFDLIEHITQPDEFIKNALKHLNDKGSIVLLTGNPDSLMAKIYRKTWWYSQCPEHIVFPSPSYFMNSQYFKTVKLLEVYNSKAYHYKPFKLLKSLVMNVMIKRTYNGVPSPYPDHQLVQIQKRN